jgi:hypothetical protein
MKKLIFITLFFFITSQIFAQEEADTSKWKFGGVGSLNFSQLSLYQWSAGGEPSFSGAAIVSLYANYKTENTSWDNSLDLGYGLIKQGDLTKKSNDRIEFTSQYGKRASGQWFYSGMLNFKTQFTEGFNYPNDSVAISTFMSPAYLSGSVGMDYKPNDKFNVFLSPVSSKMTFVFNDSIAADGNFGLEKDEKFRAEIGGFAKISYKTDLMENVLFTSKMDLFSNYLKNPQNIDINLEVLLSMKINEYLAATINALFIYDDDVNVPRENKASGPGLQAKEVFGLGLSYKF